ncbi:MAG: hypothetical protein KBF56_02335 [Gemmatimonadaceae bacterium]|nr:hypothetical protein [Gemmatimonadaceae bacterium]
MRFATPRLSRSLTLSLLAAAGLVACRGPEFVGETTGAGGGTGTGGGTVGPGGSGGGTVYTFTVDVEVRRRDGSPLEGADLLASYSGGAQLGELGVTGADGRASIDAPEGGRITVFVTEGGRHAYSARVIAGSSTLLVVHAPTLTNGHTPKNVTFSVSCPSCAVGHEIRWSLPCGQAVSTVATPGTVNGSLNGYVGCPGQDTLDAYAVWYDAAGAVKGAATVGALAFDALGAVSFPTISTSASKTLNVDVTNVGAGTPALSVFATSAAGQAYHADFAGIGAGSVKLASSAVPNLSVLSTFSGSTSRAYFRRYDAFNGGTASYDADLAGATAGTAFDGTNVSFGFESGPLGDAAQVRAVTPQVEWLFVEPAAASVSLALPVLPQSLLAFGLEGTPDLTTENVDALSADGYADLLARGVVRYQPDSNDLAGVRWATDNL